MLQILTGKFFKTEELYETHQRGVLYSNYVLHSEIETPVGRLLPVDGDQQGCPSHLIYEVTQRLEAKMPDGSGSILVATNIEPILHDFADVLSFELQITCSDKIDLVRRLTLPREGRIVDREHPSTYVPRVFDLEVRQSTEDANTINAFIDDLIGLPRLEYEAVLRAIRRYVTGLHRIADDADLAYALLVAAIESLAQGFDNFSPIWENLPHERRKPIDEVLSDIPASSAHRIRTAILKGEHLSLARRFREFAMVHIPPTFFRDDAMGRSGPIPRLTLEGALDQAYRLRSSNVHALSALPDPLSFSPSTNDYTFVDGKPTLTFSGMARMARAVIREFVRTRDKCDTEDIDYRKHLPNIVRMRLAPSVWIGRAGGYSYKTASRYLAGFLEQLARFIKTGEGSVTDLTAVLAAIESQVKGVSLKQRRPMLALYLIYNALIPAEKRREGWVELINRLVDAFDEPSIEGILCATLADLQHDWSPAEAEGALGSYLEKRFRRHGFRLPPVLEAAVALTIAESYRKSGDEAAAHRMISAAVEFYPGDKSLISLEQTRSPLPMIEWNQHLDLPASKTPDEGVSQDGQKTNPSPQQS